MTDLFQSRVIEPARAQRRDHPRQARNIADVRWNLSSVEVRTEANVLHAHSVGQIPKLLNDPIEWCGWVDATIGAKKLQREIHTHDAAGLFDRIQLAIGQIARSWHQRVRIRMR